MSTSGNSTGPVKAAFAAIALASVLTGLALYLLQSQLGIEAETARMLSIVFILVGAADTLVLFMWNRIFGPGS